MRRASEEEKASLKDRHTKVYPVELDLRTCEEIEVLIRQPTSPEYRLFLKEAANDEARHNALRKLVRPCVVWPPQTELDALIADAPAVLEALGSPILELAGMVSAKAGKAL